MVSFFESVDLIVRDTDIIASERPPTISRLLQDESDNENEEQTDMEDDRQLKQ